jgi:hypothetical protein
MKPSGTLDPTGTNQTKLPDLTQDELKLANQIANVILGCVSLSILDGLDFKEGIVAAKGMVKAFEMIENDPNRTDDVDVDALKTYIHGLIIERRQDVGQTGNKK